MRVGFMQGRLTEQVDGKIQAFPWSTWTDEFVLAKDIGIDLMEWTLDHVDLQHNPLINKKYFSSIHELSKKFGLEIHSVTGDCFMQAPFFKVYGDERKDLIGELDTVLQCSVDHNLRLVVFPLVDNSSLKHSGELDCLIDVMLSFEEKLTKSNLKIAFESDYGPQELAKFISSFPSNTFGINYDTGNSASHGYNPVEEIESYGRRICNVHIKDRKLNGPTVPLGEGEANFAKFFECLKGTAYNSNLILQTARDKNGHHTKTIQIYFEMIKEWLVNSESPA